jgi:hypothetical protein
MLRIVFIAAIAFAVSASAMAEEQDQQEQRAQAEQADAPLRQDGFIVSGDECGASRYSHLLGEQYAELHHAALPANSNVLDRGRLSRSNTRRPASTWL